MARHFSIICAILLCATAGSTQPSSRSGPPSLVYTVAPEYNPLAWLQGGDRFPRGAAVFQRISGREKALLPSFFSSADADLAFDAKTVLVAGKQKPSEHWQIWRVLLPNGTPEQITQCPDDCVRPLFLPDDRFVYAERVNGAFEMKAASLRVGTDTLQLTHGKGSFLPNFVLQDGRILFEAGFPAGDSTVSELFTVYSDGSGVEAYRCDHGRNRYAGTQLPSGDVVFSREGHLALFTSALAEEVEALAPPGIFAGDISVASNGTWLVSWRSIHDQHLSLRTWKPGTASLTAAAIHADANVIQPKLLATRNVPHRHPSALHDWTYANTLCLNAYTSKDRFEPGSVASVRMYTRDALGTTHLLGTAPIEKDGSFYLRVPGDRPLQLEILDPAGKILKKEYGWYWLRSGEQRICVGCHAGPETAPENAVPAVLLKSIVAADFTHETPSAKPQSNAGGH